MRALHSLTPPIPYPDIPAFQLEHLEALPRNEWGSRQGRLIDLWIEDHEVVGLWEADHDATQYIISCNSDYTDDRRLRRDWIAEDLRMIRNRTPPGTGWGTHQNSFIHGRGTTSELIEPDDYPDGDEDYTDNAGAEEEPF